MDRGGEKMESPLRFGLGIINIVPLRRRTTTRVWVWNLGMGIGRCQTPNPTQPMSRLRIIVSYVLVLLKECSTLYSTHTYTHTHTHTHTHKHASNNQYGIKCPITLTYIYHGISSHHKPQYTLIVHITLSHPRQQKNHDRNVGMATRY